MVNMLLIGSGKSRSWCPYIHIYPKGISQWGRWSEGSRSRV